MEKNVIKHESTNGKRRPFLASPCSEFLRPLPHSQRLGEAHPRRLSAQCDVTAPEIDISENARPTAPIIEMHRAQTLPYFDRKPVEYDAHVRLIHIVNAVSARR